MWADQSPHVLMDIDVSTVLPYFVDLVEGATRFRQAVKDRVTLTSSPF